MSSGYTPQMVDFLSMTLEGKILYTPNNNKTRHVIQKITSFITSVCKLLSAFLIQICKTILVNIQAAPSYQVSYISNKGSLKDNS